MLVFDERHNLHGRPGLHALITGVSAYPNLPGGTGTPPPNPSVMGMRQLSSPARTAYEIYRWLENRRDKLLVPLATCRLLLSPSPAEIAAVTGLRGFGSACTRDNFLHAAADWRTDATTHDENVTLFYFAGHGIQRNRDDTVLLMEDFADGIGGLLTQAVAMYNLYQGMTKSAHEDHMAQTQLYFVDTCRNRPLQFDDFDRMNVPDVFNVLSREPDERAAPIFYATVSNRAAYGTPGALTVFGDALIRCLDGAAGEAGEMDEHGETTWRVSVSSLSQALMRYKNKLGRGQAFDIAGHRGAETIIHILDHPPLTDVEVSVDPDDALNVVRVEVRDCRENTILHVQPLHPNPYQCQWSAGIYGISAEIEPPTPPYFDSPRQYRMIEPLGLTKINVKVAS